MHITFNKQIIQKSIKNYHNNNVMATTASQYLSINLAAYPTKKTVLQRSIYISLRSLTP